MGRKGWAGPDAVHKHQIHRLFGVIDCRVVCADVGPEAKGREEEQLDQQHIAQMDRRMPFADFVPDAPAGAGTEDGQDQQCEPCPTQFIAQQPIAIAQPEDKANE